MRASPARPETYRGAGGRRIIVLRDEPCQKCATPHDDSRPIEGTKAQHQVSTSERALLVGVGWNRVPRFPGMPAGRQRRESLTEFGYLAPHSGAAFVGTVFPMFQAAHPR